jgi:putative hydrolase of HD superfamily
MNTAIYTAAVKLVEQLILPFYHIERDMPIPIGQRRNENDAEHSWSLALFACALASDIDPRLDVGKVCQLAIVHDLVELFADDVSVFSTSVVEHAAKPAKEAAAREKLTAQFTELPWLTDALDIYERQDSPEAHYVRAIDKFIAPIIRSLDHGRFFKEHLITLERFRQAIVAPVAKAQVHPAAAEYVEFAHQELARRPDLFFRE